MSRWHNYYPDGHAFFCTYSAQDWSGKLDGRAVAILYEEWEKARAALGVRVLAYCIMPDHAHIVIWFYAAAMMQQSTSYAAGTRISTRLSMCAGLSSRSRSTLHRCCGNLTLLTIVG